MIFYIIIFSIVFILMLILLKIQIEIKIIIKNGNNHSFIIIRVLKGLIRLRLNLSVFTDENSLLKLSIKKTASPKTKETNFLQLISFLQKNFNSLKQYKDHIDYMKSKIKLSKLSISTTIGTGDAAATAFVTGFLMTALSMTFAYIGNKSPLESQKCTVIPYFNGTIFDLKVDCIINFKIGHIIVTGIKMILKKIKVVINHV